MLNKFFKLQENNTTVRIEITAGLTTFLTMAYIIVVQPMVLSGKMFGFSTGMDFGSVLTATCISAAIATIIMALYAKYPIAQAPGMGENFFFVFSVLPAATAAGFSNNWQVGLGVVFIAGVIFLLLSLTGVRKMIVNAISPNLKNSMAVGIGLFIAFIGLQNSGLIVSAASIVKTSSGPLLSPGTLLKMNPHFASLDLIVFFFGLFLTSTLHARKIKGSILWGIVGATLFSILLRVAFILLPDSISEAEAITNSNLMTQFSLTTRIFSSPPSLSPTFFKMDVVCALSLTMIPFIIIFLFMDIFDTIGTLIGVSEQAGFIKDGELPRANKALLSDAVGTVSGACLGTSTVTSFIESAAGVEQGGRTGLTSLITAALFLLALFLSPIVTMIGSYTVITAPALVIVGAMMLKNVSKIDWSDYSESIPAFLTLIGIPLTYSIADGLALGFISYPIIKLFSGKAREVSWLMYVISIILILYFIFIRAHIG